MDVEITNTVNLLTSYLAQLPDAVQDAFAHALSQRLYQKFEQHWYPQTPLRGNAYRSISTFDGHVDPVLSDAAHAAGIDHIGMYYPPELVVWADPGNVSYRIGFSPIYTVYSTPSYSNYVPTSGHSTGWHQPTPRVERMPIKIVDPKAIPGLCRADSSDKDSGVAISDASSTTPSPSLEGKPLQAVEV